MLETVPWETYVAIRDAFDDGDVRVSMTYLDGRLELSSPALRCEADSLLARLLHAWSEECDADLRAFGRTTFRDEHQQSGVEPDMCYTLGPLLDGAPPHLAIELVPSEQKPERLEVYRRLGIREPWMWRSSVRSIDIHCLIDRTYQLARSSRLLPSLDLPLLISYVRPGESHIALIKAYRAELRTRR